MPNRANYFDFQNKNHIYNKIKYLHQQNPSREEVLSPGSPMHHCVIFTRLCNFYSVKK